MLLCWSWPEGDATDAGEFPALDQFTAPTAGSGNTALAGALTSATTAEGAALTGFPKNWVR